jgi:hypothetical protein
LTALLPDVWTGAGVTVRCFDELPADLVHPLWEIYLAAFEGLRTRAAARQVLWPEEFAAEMADPRVWKYVALDRDHFPVGLGTVTADLRTVPWISPEFYAARYPEAAARNALYFVPFVCTDPRRARTGVYAVMFKALVSRAAADGGVLAYDVCNFNDQTIAFGQRMADWQRRLGATTVDQVDSQNYYVAEYSGGVQ